MGKAHVMSSSTLVCCQRLPPPLLLPNLIYSCGLSLALTFMNSTFSPSYKSTDIDNYHVHQSLPHMPSRRHLPSF